MSTNRPQKIACGYCQAENAVPAFASVVTCEYCGTPNELQTGKTFEQHHMLSVYFSGSELTELIPQYLSKFVGIPPDFGDKAQFTHFELRMMPFWVFKFHGRTEYSGIGKYVSPSQPKRWVQHIDIRTRPEQGKIDMDQTSLIFGYKEQHREIRDEKIPVGAKQAFDIQAVNREGGQIYDTEIGYEEAYRMAEAQIRARHNNLMFREIVKTNNVNQQIDMTEVSYLHVPFYKVKYSYGSWEGEALVDATRGKVLRAEYPISRSHRFWGLGAIFLAIAIIAGAIILLLTSGWDIAAYTGMGIFAIVLIFGLKESLTKKKVAAE